METIKISLGISFLVLLMSRWFINSSLFNRLRKTDHNILFLVPWEKGAITHGLESILTFWWTIKNDYEKEVKQGMILSNWLSIICGSLLAIWVIIVLIEKIKT
jgi:nitrogen fixation-related uncharacterized protein